MAEITSLVHSYGDTPHAQKSVFDLGEFVGDLNVEDDASSDDVSLEGLQQELEECKDDDVVSNILSKGTKLREYTKGVENNLRQVELDSIQDYIKESDNLVSLHDQIRECDGILSQMETLLSGFQSEIGSISSDIKILQEKSMDMGESYSTTDAMIDLIQENLPLDSLLLSVLAPILGDSVALAQPAPESMINKCHKILTGGAAILAIISAFFALFHYFVP